MQENENIEEVQEQPQEEQTQEQELDLSKFETADDPSVYKVDLSKPPPTAETNEKPEETTESTADDAGVVASAEDTEPVQEQEEVQPKVEAQEQPVLEEVTEEEVEQVEEAVEEAIVEAQATGEPLPENIQNLVNFVNETGGSVEDYVRLNRDYTEMDNQEALQEYYRSTKPHLTPEERAFLMEEQFSYDEEVDDEKDIRKKKIALKEQVAEAKAYLDGQKSKYYEEIKAGSKLTTEQQKAIDFFERYNKESEETQAALEKNKTIFNNKTNQVFNKNFKGIDFKVGDKTYRYNVNNVDEVKQTQSDINNFVGKFLNEDSSMGDAKSYHKSLYAAMNPDALARHFYEQGRADAMKNSVANAKNIDMTPRQEQGANYSDGPKFKVVQDESTFDFKFKKRK